VRIAITSDLHYDPKGRLTKPLLIQGLAGQIAAEEPDAVILAGDLAHGRRGFEECLSCFTTIRVPLAVIAGNHDIWADEEEGYSSDELWGHILERTTRQHGALWLEKEKLVLGETGIVGSLAWYDYSAVDPSIGTNEDFLEAMKSSLNNDANWIDWDRNDRDFAKELNQAMLVRLQELAADPQIFNILVVTHVPIVEQQIVRKPQDRRWGLSNAYFGNLTLGREVMKQPKVRAIVSGHTHVGKQVRVTRDNLSDVDVRVIDSDYGSPAYTMLTL
jgi:3',5'-cyclic AMP phosphodiesterase CpdA